MKLFFFVCLLASSAFAGSPITQTQSNHATTNVTTSAWGTIVTSLSKASSNLDIYTTSTIGTLILGIGAVGHEYNALYIHPSTARVIPLTIPKNARVSLKALNATVNAGETVINFLE